MKKPSAPKKKAEPVLVVMNTKVLPPDPFNPAEAQAAITRAKQLLGYTPEVTTPAPSASQVGRWARNKRKRL